MIVATWNINNRVGRVRFRPEAAHAGIALGADLIIFTEFYPQQHEREFRDTLAQAGWQHQLLSCESTEIANRVLVASRIPLSSCNLALPDYDQQFPSNVLAVTLPAIGLTVLGVRVPAYNKGTKPLLIQAWQWLEATAASLKNTSSVILGDLNVATTSGRAQGGDYFRRILADGWQRAEMSGEATYFGHSGRKSEIDHILATRHCTISSPRAVQQIMGYPLAGMPGAISDHAAVMCNIENAASFNEQEQ